MIYCVYMLARICSIDCYIDAVLKYILLKKKLRIMVQYIGAIEMKYNIYIYYIGIRWH